MVWSTGFTAPCQSCQAYTYVLYCPILVPLIRNDLPTFHFEAEVPKDDDLADL